jgi:GntR family transcriptional repressor for pyruvate dehydrogenase complex
MFLGLRPAADLQSLIEARALIEVELAGLAAERARAEEIRAIEGYLQRADYCIESGDVEGFLQADAEFHSSIAKAAHNPLLSQCVTLIRNSMQQVVSLAVKGPDTARRAQPFHKQIFGAIKGRRPPVARAAMRRHLSDAARLWLMTKEFEERKEEGH